VVRRAEREALPAAAEGSQVLPYLNRLSDLLWTLARWVEGEPLLAKDA
jgi:cob(I)alamin adenosyltransferase